MEHRKLDKYPKWDYSRGMNNSIRKHCRRVKIPIPFEEGEKELFDAYLRRNAKKAGQEIRRLIYAEPKF